MGGLGQNKTPLTSVQLIHITNKTITGVTVAPDLPKTLVDASTTVNQAGEYVYVIGVRDKELVNNNIDDMSELIFDIKLQVWKPLPLPNITRKYGMTFILDNILYLIGGEELATWKRLTVMECIKLNKLNLGWKFCEPYLPYALKGAASCVMGKSVWLSGGFTTGLEISRAMYRWQPGKTWDKIANLIEGLAQHAMI